MANSIQKQLQFLMYSTPDEDVKVSALVKDETIWLTQKAMGELFNVNVPAISKHLKNIFDEGELQENSVISILEIVQEEGSRSVKRKVEYYNLDAIISVGYRISSARATQFRIWATGILKEYIRKGFVLDDERLKQGENAFGADLLNAVLTTIRIPRLPRNSMRLYRTSSTLQLLGRPLQKLSPQTLMQPRNIWDFRHGKTHLTVVC